MFDMLPDNDHKTEVVNIHDLAGLLEAAFEEARRRKETHDHSTWGHMNNIQDWLRRSINTMTMIGLGSGQGPARR
jgi:hypothetical protein